jgi:glutamate/tyrosine decarboxylase-like PLP-dependent enzyme
LFNPDVHEAGVWGDALAALYNPQVGAWWHAPAASEIERHTLRFFTRTLGWDPDTTTAHFTSGGSEANHTALLAAMASRLPEVLRDGLTKVGLRPAIYVSRESHHRSTRLLEWSGWVTTRCAWSIPMPRGAWTSAMQRDASQPIARTRGGRS